MASGYLELVVQNGGRIFPNPVVAGFGELLDAIILLRPWSTRRSPPRLGYTIWVFEFGIICTFFALLMQIFTFSTAVGSSTLELP